MPRRGEYAEITLPAGARRALAEALRACCGALSSQHFSIADIASKIYCTKGNMSAWINGRRIPRQHIITALHDLAAQYLPEQTHTLDELLQLHRQAIVEDKSPVRDARPPAAEQPPHEHCGTTAGTGSAPTSGPAGRPVQPPGQNTILPVPGLVGDRQDDWTGFNDLQARIRADRLADVAGILGHVGRDSDTEEAVAAVAHCAQEGLMDEADSILIYVARRPHREIMAVIGGLLRRGRIEAAQRLVALTQEGE